MTDSFGQKFHQTGPQKPKNSAWDKPRKLFLKVCGQLEAHLGSHNISVSSCACNSISSSTRPCGVLALSVLNIL